LKIRGWLIASLVIFPVLADAAPKKSPSEMNNEELLRATQYLLDQSIQFGWQKIGIWYLISTVISFFLFWPTSKLFAGKNGKLTKNLSYFVQLNVLGVFFLAVMIVAIRSGWLGVLACLALGMLIAMVDAARKVFEVSVWRAIGMAICLSIFSAGTNLAAELITGNMPWTEFERKPADEQKELIAKWQAEKKERERKSSSSANGTALAGTATSNVQELYEQLQKTRTELNVNDPAAVARFNEQVAAYNAAKAAAAPATPAATPASPKVSGSTKQGAPPKKKTESKSRDS
jgi:hypothetical protein